MKQLSGLLVAVLLLSVSGISFAQYLGPNPSLAPDNLPQTNASFLDKEYVKFKWTWKEMVTKTVTHRATGSMYDYTEEVTKSFSGRCAVLRRTAKSIVINKNCFQELKLSFQEKFGSKIESEKVMTRSLVNFIGLKQQDLTHHKAAASEKNIIFYLG